MPSSQRFSLSVPPSRRSSATAPSTTCWPRIGCGRTGLRPGASGSSPSSQSRPKVLVRRVNAGGGGSVQTGETFPRSEPVMNLRLLAAAAVLISAAVHLYLWFDGMKEADVVGPAFMLNAVGGAVIALLLVGWRHWIPPFLALGFGLSTL